VRSRRAITKKPEWHAVFTRHQTRVTASQMSKSVFNGGLSHPIYAALIECTTMAARASL